MPDLTVDIRHFFRRLNKTRPGARLQILIHEIIFRPRQARLTSLSVLSRTVGYYNFFKRTDERRADVRISGQFTKKKNKKKGEKLINCRRLIPEKWSSKRRDQ